jgi:hypothetical protein
MTPEWTGMLGSGRAPTQKENSLPSIAKYKGNVSFDLEEFPFYNAFDGRDWPPEPECYRAFYLRIEKGTYSPPPYEVAMKSNKFYIGGDSCGQV